MQKMRFAIFGLFAALLMACSLEGGPSPSDSSTTTVPSTTRQFEQDGGGYVFETNDKDNRGHTFVFSSDAVSTSKYPFEVMAAKAGGGVAGGYGVVFARQDANDFWFADIDYAQNYVVGQVSAGTITYLTLSGSSTWVHSDALVAGLGFSNTIKIDFNGSHQYTLYLNGTQTLQFNDTAAVPATCGFGFNVGVLSYENFPDKPVSVTFTVDQPSGLSFPSGVGTGSSNLVPMKGALGVRR